MAGEPAPEQSRTAETEQPRSGRRLPAASIDPGSPDIQHNGAHPVRWSELVGILLIVALADVAIYRGKGFAGIATLLAAAPALFWFASTRRAHGAAFWITSAMLFAAATKLVWCGSSELVAIGFTLVVAFATSLAGYCPYVLRVVFFACLTIQAGALGLTHYFRSTNFTRGKVPRGVWMTIGLPVLACILFGGIFVFANPDVVHWLGERITNAIESLRRFLHRASPDLLEILFWGGAIWLVVGLLRPLDLVWVLENRSSNGNGHHHEPASHSFAYAASRNTLVTVIVLFAIYLVFEFATLWFREFPKGFYYSGYAHEGAAWLTVALALATGILSLVFHGAILRDPRIGKLRRLAWIWSLENLILAVAVYHRMFIYIGFNGMTKMRIVGFYGISAVVVGFALVLWKIARNRSFAWLIQRHLWTLATAVYLLYLTPSDAIWVNYNVRRILAGDPAPSVQIAVHPIGSEGLLLLKPLLECENEVIRNGVGALLAKRQLDISDKVFQQQQNGWTAYQLSDRLVRDGLQQPNQLQQEFDNTTLRDNALRQFYSFAYQWY